MNKAKVSILLVYCLLSLAILIMLFMHGHSIWTHLSKVQWRYIGIMILGFIPYIALGGLAFQVLCLNYRIPLEWKIWFGLSFIASFINQIIPLRAGMAFRFLYLKRHYQMHLMRFISVMSMYFLLMLLISAGLTLVGWYWSTLPETFAQLPYLVGSVFLGLIAIFFIVNRLRKTDTDSNPKSLLIPNKWFDWLNQLKSACEVLYSAPMTLLFTLLCFLAAHLINAGIIYTSFLSFNITIGFFDSLFLAGLIQLAMIFPLTPGNIGILEMFFGTVTQMIFDDFGLGFSVIALYRACHWLSAITLGSFFSFWLAGSFLPPSLHGVRLGSDHQLS